MKKLAFMGVVLLPMTLHSTELETQFYTQYPSPLSLPKNLTPHDPAINISSVFFSGQWKVEQSFYVKSPYDQFSYFFKDNQDQLFEFFSPDDQTVKDIRAKYNNFKSDSGAPFYCHRINVHKRIQKQLFSVYYKATYPTFFKSLPTQPVKGTKEWRRVDKAITDKIKQRSKGFYKKYPHKVITLIKYHETKPLFSSCGGYFYVGEEHSKYDAYFGAGQRLVIDIIDKNKFIIYNHTNKNSIWEGEYAIFSRYEV